MATTSGQSDFALSNADCLIEAFDRCEIRPSAITAEMLISGRRSLNLELTSSWPSNVPLLWKIDATPTLIPLQQGVSVYNLPTDTVTMLDTTIRTFQLPNQFNVLPAFSTVSGSNNIICTVAGNSLLPGYWFQLVTPVAIGGIVLSGFYQVTTLNNPNTFNFVAIDAALSTENATGALPLFTTTAVNTLVKVTLINHGYVSGESFNVPVLTQVGGITLTGSYVISSVVDANNFFIQTNVQATFSATAFENSGNIQIQAQSSTIAPIDRILTPIGRTDYAEFPDKFTQTIPTQYLFLRNVNPTVTLYQVPDGNGPYLLMTYLMRRIQNAGIGMGEIPDIHYLALDALCAKLAARLAVKYAKSMLPVLKTEAKEAWDNFIIENKEQSVENYVMPVLDAYWRI